MEQDQDTLNPCRIQLQGQVGHCPQEGMEIVKKVVEGLLEPSLTATEKMWQE